MYQNRKKYNRYKKSEEHSYAFGPYVVFEAIQRAPQLVEWVFYRDDFNEKAKLIRALDELAIPYSMEAKTMRRISGRDDFHLIAVIRKKSQALGPGKHLLLERIDDMGNLGNILRSALAFGFQDIAILGESCDYFHPKVIRSSMGAFFNQRVEFFSDLADYQKKFNRDIYAFRLDPKAEELSTLKPDFPFTLAFGNEGAGLSEDFNACPSVFIEQNDLVDSLNLHTAVALACYQLRRIE